MPTAYIGIGSNLNQPRVQVERAFEQLKTLEGTIVLAYSPIYETKPVGIIDQPYFFNAVAKIQTTLLPEVLLAQLLAIETAAKRIRHLDQRFGPRTLDLDILLYDQLQIHTSQLTIPHPRMLDRSFVLIPLKDIAPDLVFPDGRSIQDAVRRCKSLSDDK